MKETHTSSTTNIHAPKKLLVPPPEALIVLKSPNSKTRNDMKNAALLVDLENQQTRH